MSRYMASLSLMSLTRPTLFLSMKHGNGQAAMQQGLIPGLTQFMLPMYMDFLSFWTLWTGISENKKNIKERAFTFQVYPNPFKDNITIKYVVPYDYARFSLMVYDVSGRLVKRFQDLNMRYENQVIWDGRDDKGKRLGPGVYFIVLARDGLKPLRQKAIMLK